MDHNFVAGNVIQLVRAVSIFDSLDFEICSVAESLVGRGAEV